MEANTKIENPHRNKKKNQQAESSDRIKVISGIISESIKLFQEGKPIKLTTIKTRLCKSMKLKSQPKLTELIAAIPKQWKKKLIPYFLQKPVR